MQNQTNPQRFEDEPKTADDHADLKRPPERPANPVDTAELQNAAKERSKKRPLLQRIIKAIKGENKAFRNSSSTRKRRKSASPF